MESYQWQYQPTPEETKKRKRNAKTMMLIWIIGIPVMSVIGFYLYDFATSQIVYFIVADIIMIAFLYFFVIRRIMFGPLMYVINDEGIIITELKSNRVQKYLWKNYKSFSDSIDVYTKEGPRTKDDDPKYKYLYLSKHEKYSKYQDLFKLRIERDKEEKVRDLLRQKLTELKDTE